MKRITTSELRRQLDGPNEFTLVNVLAREAYEQQRIPESFNAPVNEPDFVERIMRFVEGDKDENIVVYCAEKSCNAALMAIRRLEKEGFSNVFHYEGGMEAWANAGHPVDAGVSSGPRD